MDDVRERSSSNSCGILNIKVNQPNKCVIDSKLGKAIISLQWTTGMTEQTLGGYN